MRRRLGGGDRAETRHDAFGDVEVLVGRENWRLTRLAAQDHRVSVLGADVLIGLLKERDRDLREAAAWALEAISGTAGGEAIGHWEAWWQSLPAEVEPAS